MRMPSGEIVERESAVTITSTISVDPKDHRQGIGWTSSLTGVPASFSIAMLKTLIQLVLLIADEIQTDGRNLGTTEEL